MGDLSPHFSRYEFACKDGCGRNTIDFETLNVLEDVRVHFGTSVVINSGYRCQTHNKKVHGGVNSQHLYGRAADIRVSGVKPSDVQEYLKSEYPDKYGIGSYNTFTHIDTRTGGPVRWSGK